MVVILTPLPSLVSSYLRLAFFLYAAVHISSSDHMADNLELDVLIVGAGT